MDAPAPASLLRPRAAPEASRCGGRVRLESPARRLVGRFSSLARGCRTFLGEKSSIRDRVHVSLAGRLIEGASRRLVGRLLGRPATRLAGWLAGEPTGRSVDCSLGSSAGRAAKPVIRPASQPASEMGTHDADYGGGLVAASRQLGVSGLSGGAAVVAVVVDGGGGDAVLAADGPLGSSRARERAGERARA